MHQLLGLGDDEPILGISGPAHRIRFPTNQNSLSLSLTLYSSVSLYPLSSSSSLHILVAFHQSATINVLLTIVQFMISAFDT